MPRNNKTIVMEINQVSSPDAGTRYPSGKPNTDEDTLKGGGKKEAYSGPEGKVQAGACLKAMRVQAGERHLDNMNQTKAGNAPDECLEY